MMPTLRIACSVVALVAALALAPAAWAGVPPGVGPAGEIPAGKTLVVVGQGQPEVFAAHAAVMGRKPAGVMSYSHLGYSPDAYAKELARTQAMLELFPGAVLNLGLTMGNSVVFTSLGGDPKPPGAVEVVAGRYDEQLDQLAAWLNALPVPVLLRVGYEFDLLGGQYGGAEDYKAAYRYMVDRLRAAGVDNVSYVWHSAGAYFRALDYSGMTGLFGSADPAPGSTDAFLQAIAALDGVEAGGLGIPTDLLPIERFYPGDGYVDYFGISFWDDACCFGRSSDEARGIYRRRTRELLGQAQGLGLPIVIGEATPAYIGGNSGEASVEWIRQQARLIEEFDIRATAQIIDDWTQSSLFSQPYWGGYWPDARLHTVDETCRAWLAETSKGRYINGAVIGAPAARCRPAAGPRCTPGRLGTAAADTPRTLPPSRAADAIRGRGGGDTIRGGRGPDCLRGDRGGDSVAGDRGADRVFGGPGADRVTGGRGRDRVVGGPGRDVLAGGRGIDLIVAVDGAKDRVRCGRGGRDRVVVDRSDRVHPTCEVVRIRRARSAVSGLPSRGSRR